MENGGVTVSAIVETCNFLLLLSRLLFEPASSKANALVALCFCGP